MNVMGGACSSYGKRRNVYTVLLGIPEGKRPLGRPIVDERIILKWIFKKRDEGHGMD
jgi:hypothetical protein